MRLIDIAVNLTDPMFRGVYHGSTKHTDDLLLVMQRAARNGLERLIVTGTSLQESRDAVALCTTHPADENIPQLFATVGCHPTRCQEFVNDDQRYLSELGKLIRNANASKRVVVAVGECGLDYDRLQFCPKPIQRKYFEMQLQLAKETDLPLFLHNRGTDGDFLATIRRFKSTEWPAMRGVVHSFDGGLEEMQALAGECGLYIGINGW